MPTFTVQRDYYHRWIEPIYSCRQQQADSLNAAYEQLRNAHIPFWPMLPLLLAMALTDTYWDKCRKYKKLKFVIKAEDKNNHFNLF